MCLIVAMFYPWLTDIAADLIIYRIKFSRRCRESNFNPHLCFLFANSCLISIKSFGLASKNTFRYTFIHYNLSFLILRFSVNFCCNRFKKSSNSGNLTLVLVSDFTVDLLANFKLLQLLCLVNFVITFVFLAYSQILI